jgi:hypothetical protein
MNALVEQRLNVIFQQVGQQQSLLPVNLQMMAVKRINIQTGKNKLSRQYGKQDSDGYFQFPAFNIRGVGFSKRKQQKQ